MATNNQKKDLLLQSFNVLNTDLEDNSSKIAEIIEKMSKIDFETAWEMWTYILNNWDVRQYGNETFAYTDGMLLDLIRVNGIEKITKSVLEDTFIKRTIYNESAIINSKILAYLIDTHQLEPVNDILELMYSNPNLGIDDEDSFGYYLDYTLSVECDQINEKKVDFLLSWVERVKSEKFKANMQVTLIDYM